MIFYGISGKKLAAYQMRCTFIYPGPSVPTLERTGDWWYFGGKLVKNATGYVGQDRIGSVRKFFPYGQEKPSATANNKEKFATYYRDSESRWDGVIGSRQEFNTNLLIIDECTSVKVVPRA